ncbi:glyoxalase [Pseudoalteromonas piscicida]|uniref:VOC family protein n=1 Tax=Pseudoalteromonas piscicida TaxID=43662 RepID=UPI00273A380F|nr:VOC family protein [Pseudoalteromonas piscicida]MDP4486851.1 glyoxalase [Pseudoalteromonas piscicida]
MMVTVDSLVLYVSNIKLSEAFYRQLFQCETVKLSPTFVSMKCANNISIALKQNTALTPPSRITGGGTEISIVQPSQEAFFALYDTWKLLDIKFAQVPQAEVYGASFVVLDPDKHRIRVFINKNNE